MGGHTRRPGGISPHITFYRAAAQNQHALAHTTYHTRLSILLYEKKKKNNKLRERSRSCLVRRLVALHWQPFGRESRVLRVLERPY